MNLRQFSYFLLGVGLAYGLTVGAQTPTIFSSIRVNNGSDLRGQIVAGDGTDIAPAYSFRNNTDSGLWLDGSDKITLQFDESANGARLELGGLDFIGVAGDGGAVTLQADDGVSLDGGLAGAYTPLLGINAPANDALIESLWGGPLPDGTIVLLGNADASGAQTVYIANETGIDPATQLWGIGAGANGSNGSLSVFGPWGSPLEFFADAGGTSGVVALGIAGSDYIEMRSNIRADTVVPLRLFSTSVADQFIEFQTDLGPEPYMLFTDGISTINGTIAADTLTLDGDVTVTGTCTGCGGGTPGGSDGQVQFNSGGAFAGDAGLTYSAAADDLTVGSQVFVGNGTFSNPSFSFANDPDTGVYLPAGNQIGFSTGGGSRMTLSSTSVSIANTGSFVVDPLTTLSGGATVNGTLTANAPSIFSNTVTVDVALGADELTITNGSVAMIGTTTGGSAGGVPMTPAQGTFTATFDDACTTSPTITFDYYVIGNSVTLQVDESAGFTCTSDSTNLATTGTPVPAAIRPSDTAGSGVGYASYIGRSSQDNGTAGAWQMLITTAGNIQFSYCPFAATCTTWTNSGTKTVSTNRQSFPYILGDQ